MCGTDTERCISDKERRLVEELTQPTGVRAVPSTAELNQFVRSCQQGALDLFALYDALTDKLASNRWQARLVSRCTRTELYSRLLAESAARH